MNSGNEYSLSEFRANLREAFNAAEKGEPVYIERYGVTYCLMSTDNFQDTLNNLSGNKAAYEKIKSDSQSEQKGGQ